jgi:perosamine synthetase
VIAALEREGVATARYFPCVHLQPYMRESYGFAEGLCPVAEAVSKRTLALPFHTGIGATDQERVADTLASAVRAG